MREHVVVKAKETILTPKNSLKRFTHNVNLTEPRSIGSVVPNCECWQNEKPLIVERSTFSSQDKSTIDTVCIL